MKITTHANEDAAVSYILNNLDERAFALIVLNSISPVAVDYTLRFNYTALPNTNIVEVLLLLLS